MAGGDGIGADSPSGPAVSPVTLREFSRIAFDPSLTRLQKTAYRALVYSELRARGVGHTFSTQDVIESLATSLQMRSIPPLMVQDALRAAKDEGIVRLTDDLWTIVAEPPSPPPSPLELLHEGFLGQVSELFGKLDRHQIGIASEFLDSVLAHLLSDVERNAQAVLRGEPEVALHSFDVDGAVRSHFQGVADDKIERAEKLKGAVRQAIRSYFGRLLPKERDALGALVQIAVLCRVVISEPDAINLTAKMFEGARLHLDTNVLFALFCKGSQDHLETEWIVTAARALGLRIEVLESTRDEFERAILKDSYVFRAQRGSYVDPDFSSRDLPRTYYRFRKDYADWYSLVASIRVSAARMTETYGIEVIPDVPVEITDVEAQVTRLAIESEGSRRDKSKDPNTVLHDLAAIQVIREHNRISARTTRAHAWLLTRDRGLIRADARASRTLRQPAQSVIGYETFVRLVSPVLGAEARAGFVTVLGEMFRKEIAPIDQASVETFVAYTLEAVGPNVSPEVLARVSAEAHFGRLAADLAHDNVPSALAEIRRAIDVVLPGAEAAAQTRSAMDRIISIVKGTAGEAYRAPITSASGIAGVATAILDKLRFGIRGPGCPEDEAEVQFALDTLLRTLDYRVSKDIVQIPFAGKGYRPDFVLEFKREEVPIEVKLLSEPGQRARIISEMSDDLTAYTTRWKTVIFVVYDCGVIRDQADFKEAFERKGAIVVVVKH